MAYKGPQEVTGPSSSVDNTIPRFDGTVGDIVQTSGVSITDANVCNGITQLNVDNLRLDGNTVSSTDTNGNITLSPDGSGTVSVTAAPIVPTGDRADSLGSATNSWDNVYCDGVTFDDGGNVLSAYETGSWTPVLRFGGTSTGITYSVQTGTYTRIGNVVFGTFQITLTSKGTDTGAASISGLPFTVGTFVSNPLSAWSGFTLDTNYTVVVFQPNAAGTTGALNQSDPTGAGGYIIMDETNFSGTDLFTTGFHYFI